MFTSLVELRTARLHLRQWRAEDREPFAALNADPEVMAFFRSTLTRDESNAMADRLEKSIAQRGWGWWAVEVPGVVPFIGFVGLGTLDDMPFSPCVEVGWRVRKDHWGRGYATEAAREVTRFGFEDLKLPEIVSFTAASHWRSRAVMERLGMRERGLFEHPRLPEGHALRTHVLYRLTVDEWMRYGHEPRAES